MSATQTGGRIEVAKTLKLYVNGAFPRSESGRTVLVLDARKRAFAHASHASRKDLRDAVEAASAAQPKWAAATAYNRGQVLYRLAEMLESRRAEFASLMVSIEGRTKAEAAKEVDRAIDRCVCFAGWTDKIAAVLGGKHLLPERRRRKRMRSAVATWSRARQLATVLVLLHQQHAALDDEPRRVAERHGRRRQGRRGNAFE